MATTRIIPMHINKGKTLAQCLSDRLDYGENPDKTKDGEFISSYECDPETAASEFLLSKKRYRTLTGRIQDSDVIAYQIRQSFKPGEITPEEANRIGYELPCASPKENTPFSSAPMWIKSTSTTVFIGTRPGWTAPANSATFTAVERRSGNSVISSASSIACR